VSQGPGHRGVAGRGDPPRLRLRNVAKAFASQWALAGVDLDLQAGQIHGLVGENGSGKSTLIKILAGFHHPESGASAELSGTPFDLGSQAAAEQAGMRFVHQDLGLIPALDTVDNLALGRGYRSRAWISMRRERRAAQEMLASFGIDLDVRRPIAALAPVERSMIAIVRALSGSDRDLSRCVLVLDEPTESLPGPAVEPLFRAIRAAAADGAAVLFVSHRLEEVLELADDVTVLRDGRVVARRRRNELDHDALVELIVGRPLEAVAGPRPGRSKADVALRLTGITGRLVEDVSINVHRGEILGLAGIVGSGRDEVLGLAGGATPLAGGAVEADGQTFTKLGPRDALGAGVVYVPPDRQAKGTIQTLSIRENVLLPRLRPRGPLRWLSVSGERDEAQSWIERTGVQPAEPERVLGTLSGGNQQKVVLARALRCHPKVLLLDEPTHGVDVGARAAILALLREAADGGMGVVISTVDFETLAAACDRVVVFRNGRIAACLEGDDNTSQMILRRALARDDAEPRVEGASEA
jgi:ribose transport system ATP-binding protein